MDGMAGHGSQPTKKLGGEYRKIGMHCCVCFGGTPTLGEAHHKSGTSSSQRGSPEPNLHDVTRIYGECICLTYMMYICIQICI